VREIDEEKLKEKRLVEIICEEIEQNKDKIYGLKYLRKCVNLSKKSYSKIWESFWEGKIPPDMEIDIILVSDGLPNKVDDAFITAVEVKWFKDINKRNFYEGIGQTLGYASFGFDSLVLWHLFSNSIVDAAVEKFASTVEEIIEGFGLSIVYFASKVEK